MQRVRNPASISGLKNTRSVAREWKIARNRTTHCESNGKGGRSPESGERGRGLRSSRKAGEKWRRKPKWITRNAEGVSEAEAKCKRGTESNHRKIP